MLAVRTFQGSIHDVRSVTLAHDGTEVKGWPGPVVIYRGTAGDAAEVMGIIEDALRNRQTYVDVQADMEIDYVVSEAGRIALAEFRGVL